MASRNTLDIEEDFYASGCTVHDAYKRFIIEDKVEGGHYKIYLHSNGLCYLTLASTHPIIKQNLAISSVEFPIQRMSNKVSGKRKRGSQYLQSDSHLCTVNTDDGRKFTLRAGVNAKLAEINRKLLELPDLIKSPTMGYMAIFITRCVDLESGASIPKNWILEEDFLKNQEEEKKLLQQST